MWYTATLMAEGCQSAEGNTDTGGAEALPCLLLTDIPR